MADELPALPLQARYMSNGPVERFGGTVTAYYTADQMRTYAQAAVLQERERCAKAFAYSLAPTSAIHLPTKEER